MNVALTGAGVACVAAMLLLPLLRRFAVHLRLVDRPGGRKSHVGEVPLIGGLAIFVAYVAALVVTGNFALWGWGTFLVWTAIVMLGLWDDIRHIPVIIRVVVQVTAIVALCAHTGIQLRNLGDLTGQGPVLLGVLSLPVTILGLIGVKNGINLIDGLDGLAGTQVLAPLAWFFVLCLAGGRQDLVLTILPLAGAVTGFLVFNLHLPRRPATVFLGDHGSVFLGFTLAWIAVVGSQGGQAAFTPIEAVWVLGLPVLDTIRVMLSRLARHQSPFSPGRDHLHYLLVDSGLSVNATVGLLLMLSLLLGAVAWAGRILAVSEVLLLCLFLAVSLVFFLAGRYLEQRALRPAA